MIYETFIRSTTLFVVLQYILFASFVLREWLGAGHQLISTRDIDLMGVEIEVGTISVVFDKYSCGVSWIRAHYGRRITQIRVILGLLTACCFYLYVTSPVIPIWLCFAMIICNLLFLASFYFLYWKGCRGSVENIASYLFSGDYDRISYDDGVLYLHRGREIISQCNVFIPESEQHLSSSFRILIGFVPLGRQYALWSK